MLDNVVKNTYNAIEVIYVSKLIDLTGKKIGRLTVIGKHGHNKHGQLMWECLCDCGNKTVVVGQNLRRGMTKSCGCNSHLPTTKTHGMTGTVLHKRWLNMKSRCNNPNNKRYERYGGRGIKVCKEWENDFMAFYNWAISNGFEESLSIDRIDNNKGYSPDNCRWATPRQQANNTRRNIIVERDGEKVTLSDLCRNLGLNYRLVLSRIESGMTVEMAISKDFKKRIPERDKYYKELEEKAQNAGIKYHTVYSRIFVYGWSEEKALTTPVHHSRSYHPKPLSRPDKNSVHPSRDGHSSKDKP